MGIAVNQLFRSLYLGKPSGFKISIARAWICIRIKLSMTNKIQHSKAFIIPNRMQNTNSCRHYQCTNPLVRFRT